MKCNKCGYEWINRKKEPKACPACKQYRKEVYRHPSWAERNPEKSRERSREYARHHREENVNRAMLWNKEHPERRREIARKWNKKNPESHRENVKRYRKNHPDIIRAKVRLRQAKRRRIDENFRIRQNLRKRIREALIAYGDGKKGSINKYGINYSKIIEYLGKCPNDGRKYHIDHIIPLCSFDLTNPNEIKKAFAPENHQWLEASENIKKSIEDMKKSLK